MSPEILNLAQTITAVVALVGSAYSLVVQRREMNSSARLNAAATLFQYYNAKISSLRESIVRDGGTREQARLVSLADRENRLDQLLKTHERMLDDLEKQYAQSAQ